MGKEKHKGEGHRKRLRDKFLRAGIGALHDYEIVELLLTLGTPRKDCKDQAKEAIKKFGGLKGVLEASPNDKSAEELLKRIEKQPDSEPEIFHFEK